MFSFYKGLILAAVCCAFLLPLASINAGEKERVEVSYSVQAIQIRDSISARLSAKAEWSLLAVDMETGNKLVSAGSVTSPLIPGSLMKLFVTAALLNENSKEAIDFSTVVSLSGEVKKNKLKGDLILKGVGNPFLSTKDLQEAVEKIKSLGIKEISGDIVIDDSLFDTKGWKNRYTGPAYAMPSALGLDMHTVSITAEGSSQKVQVDPVNDEVKVSFNPSGKAGVRQIDDLTYEVTGATLDAPVVHKRFSLMLPAVYAGQTFVTLLKQAGIEVRKASNREGAKNAKETGGLVLKTKPLSDQESLKSLHREGAKDAKKSTSQGLNSAPFASLREKEICRIGILDIQTLVRDTNKHSLNVAADNMLLLLGSRKYDAPGTKEKGIQAVNEFLSSLGVATNGLVIDDGSGVSERNRISAEEMTTFLHAAAAKPWFPIFFESLSRPGMDGRLSDFGYKSDRIRAKSGEVSEAYSLAGYVQQANGRKIAFTYIVNGMSSDVNAASVAAVDVLRRLEQLH